MTRNIRNGQTEKIVIPILKIFSFNVKLKCRITLRVAAWEGGGPGVTL
jgi:hypothetical protein